MTEKFPKTIEDLKFNSDGTLDTKQARLLSKAGYERRVKGNFALAVEIFESEEKHRPRAVIYPPDQ